MHVLNSYVYDKKVRVQSARAATPQKNLAVTDKWNNRSVFAESADHGWPCKGGHKLACNHSNACLLSRWISLSCRWICCSLQRAVNWQEPLKLRLTSHLLQRVQSCLSPSFPPTPSGSLVVMVSSPAYIQKDETHSLHVCIMWAMNDELRCFSHSHYNFCTWREKIHLIVCLFRFSSSVPEDWHVNLAHDVHIPPWPLICSIEKCNSSSVMT